MNLSINHSFSDVESIIKEVNWASRSIDGQIIPFSKGELNKLRNCFEGDVGFHYSTDQLFKLKVQILVVGTLLNSQQTSFEDRLHHLMISPICSEDDFELKRDIFQAEIENIKTLRDKFDYFFTSKVVQLQMEELQELVDDVKQNNNREVRSKISLLRDEIIFNQTLLNRSRYSETETSLNFNWAIDLINVKFRNVDDEDGEATKIRHFLRDFFKKIS